MARRIRITRSSSTGWWTWTTGSCSGWATSKREMKTFRGLFLILILILVTNNIVGQTPFGTQKVKNVDNLYIDCSEVTNIGWMEYLYFIKNEYGENSPQYKAALPDTTLTGYSFKHPSYRNYPVVGITYEQALDYAQWRTKAANIILEQSGKKYRYEYLLASEEVLQQAFLQQKSKSVQLSAMQAVSSKKLVHIDDNAKEITSNKTIFIGATDDKLFFEAYKQPDSLTSFRCMARVAK